MAQDPVRNRPEMMNFILKMGSLKLTHRDRFDVGEVKDDNSRCFFLDHLPNCIEDSADRDRLSCLLATLATPNKSRSAAK